MVNVKVFVDKRTGQDLLIDWMAFYAAFNSISVRKGQELYAHDLSMQGHKNKKMLYQQFLLFPHVYKRFFSQDF